MKHPYQYVLEDLLKLPGSKFVNQDQIRMKCPICNHHNNKLYVGLNRSLLPKMVLGFECKHCPYTGSVTKKFLDNYDIQGHDEYLKELKTRKQATRVINPISKLEKMNFKIPDYILPEDQFKVDYLSKRFNREVTIRDIKKYKIILNFKDFFKYNNFDYTQYESQDREALNKLEYLADEFTKHFVGMLSVDNNKINFRNISSKSIKKRYMVYVVNRNIGNPYIYMPDVPIDLLAPQPTIHMSEGTYDIIGIKELFSDDDDYSHVYVSVGTRKAYVRCLKQVLKMTVFLNAELIVYIDNDDDVDLRFYRDLFKEFEPLFDDIVIICNEAIDDKGKPVKDFGDLSKPFKLARYSLYRK